MTDVQEVMRSNRSGPRHEPRVSGMGVLALVCGGLFGGRARGDSGVLARLSRSMQTTNAMAYRQAA